jgi:hypothetical protein
MSAGDNSQIYQDLMRLKPEGWSPNAWAIKAGVSRTVWADMRRHGNPSRRTLEKLLAAAGSSLAEFEALRLTGVGALGAAPSAFADRRSGWGSANLPGLPLFATAIGGKWNGPEGGIEMTELRVGDLVERLARPASIAGDQTAYAVTIVGQSMWPRFRPGRRVAVSPKAPVAIGDDVLVKLKQEAGGREGMGGKLAILIGELVGRSAGGFELRQFNPDLVFQVPAAEIQTVEKVLGELV